MILLGLRLLQQQPLGVSLPAGDEEAEYVLLELPETVPPEELQPGKEIHLQVI